MSAEEQLTKGGLVATFITGDTEVIARLSTASPRVLAGLRKTVGRLTILLQRHVVADKLSGQVLRNQTGTLRRSINAAVTEAADSVRGTVGTNLKYGAAWELGFKRTMGAGTRGGPRTLTGAARETYFAKHPRRVVSVQARPFLRPALADHAANIREELAKAVIASLKELR